MKTLYKLLLLLIIPLAIVTCKDDEPEVPVGSGNKITIQQTQDSVSYWEALYDGSITGVKNRDILQYGQCWDTLPNVDLSKNFTALGSTNKDIEFKSLLENLQPNKTYYISAYFELEKETVFSVEETFTTPKIEIPKTKEQATAKPELYTAILYGEITDTGGELISKGFYYSENPNITEDDNQIINIFDSTIFADTLTNLLPNKTYYAKVFGSNRAGVGFSNEFTFTTKTKLAIIETTTPTEILAYSCKTGGNITDDFGSTITQRGVCWSISTMPTIDDAKTDDGTGIGQFESIINDLTPVTKYYIRAYTTNSSGTSYGNEFSITTAKAVPIVDINEVTEITATSAKTGGSIIFDGGDVIISKGVCWSTSDFPTIADDKTTNGEGSSNYVSELFNLSANTTYFVRSYATNSAGIGYGDVIIFTTLAGIPTLTTSDIADISATTATSGGSITDDGGDAISTRGVCYSTSENPTINNDTTINGLGIGNYTSNITELTENTTYYVRAYATNSIGTVYGSEKTFTTNDLPTVTTTAITDITTTTAISGGNVTANGNATVTARGVCWSKNQNPTIANSKTSNGTGTGIYISNITELIANTTYYVRAYATNIAGTSYGSEVIFTTSKIIVLPTITTTAITDITTTTATSGGNVTADGNATITARGVCWSTAQNPTIADNKTSNDTGTGSFVSNITQLSTNTTYYVRAYATNSKGTSYGSEVSFTTSKIIILPTVTTTAITDITTTTATSGGEVTNDGNATVTARGICWSTSQNPTITDSNTSDGNGLGTFISSLTSLTENTTYYVRSYATNEKGTSYGNEVSFTTNEAIVLPTINTVAISNITKTTATSGGNITNEGNGTISAKGICWSTSQNPTTSNSYTNDGAGINSFVSNISGLTEGTTYFVKSYAINEAGTAYGNEIEFTTVAIVLPTVTTATITDITTTTATGGGEVTNDGNGTISARGVCWSTSQSPTITDSHTSDGSGVGAFVSSITDLTENTTYYARAYATNEKGTTYGNEIEFTSSKHDITGETGTLTDIDGNMYNWVGIGTQAWITENLKTTHYPDGTAIPLVNSSSNWTILETDDDAYCFYADDENSIYGAIYTYASAIANNWTSDNMVDQGVCPDGWHLPSLDEWIILGDFISVNGYEGEEAKALKSTSGWINPNTGQPEWNGIDQYGFNALPGGARNYHGGNGFDYVGSGGYWWSSTETTESGFEAGFFRHMSWGDHTISGADAIKYRGLSVRCVKD